MNNINSMENKLRLIKAGTEIWSINNQANFIIKEDMIVEITATCYSSEVVYVKPMQLIFNFPGHIPTVIGRGRDEWGVDSGKTELYEVPSPVFY